MGVDCAFFITKADKKLDRITLDRDRVFSWPKATFYRVFQIAEEVLADLPRLREWHAANPVGWWTPAENLDYTGHWIAEVERLVRERPGERFAVFDENYHVEDVIEDAYPELRPPITFPGRLTPEQCAEMAKWAERELRGEPFRL